MLYMAQGLNSCPLQWKLGVLTTGPPGKSLTQHFKALSADPVLYQQKPGSLAQRLTLGPAVGNYSCF